MADLVCVCVAGGYVAIYFCTVPSDLNCSRHILTSRGQLLHAVPITWFFSVSKLRWRKAWHSACWQWQDCKKRTLAKICRKNSLKISIRFAAIRKCRMVNICFVGSLVIVSCIFTTLASHYKDIFCNSTTLSFITKVTPMFSKSQR